MTHVFPQFQNEKELAIDIRNIHRGTCGLCMCLCAHTRAVNYWFFSLFNITRYPSPTTSMYFKHVLKDVSLKYKQVFSSDSWHQPFSPILQIWLLSAGHTISSGLCFYLCLVFLLILLGISTSTVQKTPPSACITMSTDQTPQLIPLPFLLGGLETRMS